MLRFNNHLVCCIHSRISFCVHFRSLSRYVRSCFAHQLLRSLNSHSSAIQWQMLRSIRQVKQYGCQIMIPLPLTFLTHSAIARSGFPGTKSAPPLLGSRRQAPSYFGLPPSTTLAPLAAARALSLRKENHVAALRSFSFAPFPLKAA